MKYHTDEVPREKNEPREKSAEHFYPKITDVKASPPPLIPMNIENSILEKPIEKSPHKVIKSKVKNIHSKSKPTTMA